MLGRLFLIPTPIQKGTFQEVLSESIRKTIRELNYFIVENEKSTRLFIKEICPEKPQEQLNFFKLPKPDQKAENIDLYLEPLFKGYSMGLLSEVGLPCIADPGSDVVLRAHLQGLTVVPLSGPSSIFMTLMASGLSGQQFAFHGYLPIAKDLLKRKIKFLERHSRENKQTQMFMETPYRNKKLLEVVFSVCDKNTLLTIATELTGANEMIRTRPVWQWAGTRVDLEKKPSLFALLAS